MVKINLHRRFDFNIARGSYFGWVKFLFSSKHGINYPYKLIYNSNNRLFVTTKALSLLFKVDPKYRIVNYGHHSHLKEDISKMRVPLLRDTHPLPPSSRLFNNRIIPSIAYKVPARRKEFDRANLCHEPSSKNFTYAPNRTQYLFLPKKPFLYKILKGLLKKLKLRVKKKELVNVKNKRNLKSFVSYPNGILCKFNNIQGTSSRFSSPRGFSYDFINRVCGGLSYCLRRWIFSDNYALVLWNHGNGWREVMEERGLFPFKAICWDDTSGGDCLFMKEVGDALETIENDIQQVDLVGFDACLMGMAEVAYEIKDHASVMVGSEETEPGDGWPYDTILPDLTANPIMSPADLACVIVNRYGESYGAGSGTTQSAFDLANMSSLAAAISNFGNLMIGSAYKSEIATCRGNSQEYFYPWHIDLYHFADLASTGVPDATIQAAANNVKTQINNTIICEFHSSQLPNSHGAGIYFPNCPSHSLNPDYNPSVIDFAADTYWDEFLGWYCGVLPPCEGDFDNDGDVDGSDLAVFAADFGRTDCDTGPACEGDFDHDGDVDGSDLAVFAADFGRTDCPH